MGRRTGGWALVGSVAATRLAQAAAWGNKQTYNEGDYKYYANSKNEWKDSSTVAMKVLGCAWGRTDYNEDVGCMQDESGDGTTYWYQMAECKRAQVVYSVYASDGSTSCSSGDYKGTYQTQYGLPEFSYLLNGFANDYSIDTSDLPMCEQANNGYYLAVGCGEDGSFTIDQFSDEYCLQRVGYYGNAKSVNNAMKTYKSCYNIYDAKSGNSFEYSLGGALIKESTTCSKTDDSICPSNERVTTAASGKNFVTTKAKGIANINVANKAKYALGTLCLIGSLFMFLGILFTNRRKRRAMMHRKMRASRAKRRSSSKRGDRSSSRTGRSSSSRSKSRSRTEGSSSRREGSSSRSKSRSRKVEDGVFA